MNFKNIKYAFKNDDDVTLVYDDESRVTKPLSEASEAERFMVSYYQTRLALDMQKEILWATGKPICEPDFDLNIKVKGNSDKILQEYFNTFIIEGKSILN